jgi:anti-sigma B factor antagonist
VLDHRSSPEPDPRPHITILRLSGELDSSRAGEVRDVFAEVPTGAMVVVVLTEVPFIDSAGLGALIGGIRRIRDKNGDVVLCGARPGVARVLTVSGVDQLVRLEPDVEAATVALAWVSFPRLSGHRP